MYKIIILLLSVSGIITAGCTLLESKAPDSPTFSYEKYKGLWESPQYGYYLLIDESGMSLFDHTSSMCLKNPVSPSELSLHLKVFVTVDNDQFTASPHPGASHYRFNRIQPKLEKEIISSCKTESNKDPLINFKYFTELMQEHYAFFSLHNIDWEKRTEEFKKQIKPTTSNKQLLSIFSQMLDGISDAHTFLKAELNGSTELIKTGHSRVLRPALDRAFLEQLSFDDPREFRQNWFNQYLSNINDDILSGNGNLTDSNRILWGKIGNKGYINILRMAGFSDTGLMSDEVKIASQEMATIMNSLKDSDSIIVDVTANGGGEDEVSRVIAGYFTNRSLEVYEKFTKDGINPPQVFEIQPAEITFTGPVTLLTSDHTVSAAEVFTMSMATLQHVTHVGERTRGALSDTLDKRLPNGWEVGLSNEVYRDMQGRVPEGVGISPVKHISIFGGEDIYTSHSLALSRFLEM
ncbi:S41 family peptidase [Pseudoalteromonas sp. H105]|uniref:S41 family peptidase n=1 Tax=Pseudoalteromonas sp. H105 TaxID=1348393 RepID=UPI000731F995|nr:S41 family peptidase [Pseudoalteromonas sp. H105]KTF13706.1 hypothetical protein ATS75_14130 [Pseudoalteromonas sp. H105]